MSQMAKPREGPINVHFIDLHAQLKQEFQIDRNTEYPRFLSLLTHASAKLSPQIKGLARPLSPRHGFTASDGPWWFRIARSDGTYKSANRDAIQHPISGSWRILDAISAYDSLLADMVLGVDTEGGWVEVEHHMQKTRDEQAFRKMSAGFALVKNTVRSGYDSRVTSEEFQDVQNDRDISATQGGTQHRHNLSIVPEVAMAPPVSGVAGHFASRLYSQTKSEPRTPYGLPSPLLDPALWGPMTGKSLPAEDTPLMLMTAESNNQYPRAAVTSVQSTSYEGPTYSSAIAGADPLLGATAHYEARETQAQLPTIVDSSVIHEDANGKTPLAVSTNPSLPTPFAVQDVSSYSHGSIPYRQHDNFGPATTISQQHADIFQRPMAQGYNNHHQRGAARGAQVPQRGRSRAGSKSASPNKRKVVRGDSQDWNKSQSAANRGRGSANPNPNNFPSRGGRASYQTPRGQMGRGMGQPRHINAGLLDPSLDRFNPPGCEIPPQIHTGYLSGPGPQYHHMMQAPMYPLAYQGGFATSQTTYQYGSHTPGYQFTSEQDWAAVRGVNTDIMTESEIQALNRQRLPLHGPQPLTPAISPIEVLPRTSEQQELLLKAIQAVQKSPFPKVVEPEYAPDLTPVHEAQTALDVTTSDPLLTGTTSDGPTKAPVTKFPPTISFGTAPYIQPMELRSQIPSTTTVKAITKRQATRRANREKAKVEANNTRAEKQETKTKQARSRAARAQRRESMIVGDGKV